MNPRAALGPLILLAAGVVALVAGLLFGGGAAPLSLGDAGPFVRWGLPVARLITHLSAAAMIGSLVLALFALRPGKRPFEIAVNLVSTAAAIFTVSAATTAFLLYLSAFNPTLSADRSFGDDLARFLFELPLGQAWSITIVLGAVTTLAAFAWRGWTTTLFTAGLAVVALLPIATTGHATSDPGGHGLAVNSVFLHTVAAAGWLGGLILLAVLRAARAEVEWRPLLERYSSIAIAAFIVVAASGIARSYVALDNWGELATPYGLLIVAKTVALAVLGVFGAAYRMRLIPKATGADAGPWFWRLVAAELAVMGIAMGIATALGRTPSPLRELPGPLTPAERLIGEPVPPELTPIRWITMWDVDILWLLAGLFGLFFYYAAVWRLHRRGDRWPIYRTVLWTAGILLLIWVTNGSINLYQDFLFSVHMLGHMLLGMGIPLLLVAGAPVTLALRAIRKRHDGTRGGREWIMWGVHSPYSKVITHPIVAAAIFILSLWAFYFTGLFRWSMYDHLGHQWMIIHFLISGYLFVMTLVGSDPLPYRLPYAGRLVTLITTMAMHAFFGVALMMQTGLMVADWFGSTGRTWGASPMDDQYVGGGIAWSIGEIPTLILAVTVAILWSRSDARLTKRRDRHADRTGEAELAAYNEQLARLAERDARRSQ